MCQKETLNHYSVNACTPRKVAVIDVRVRSGNSEQQSMMSHGEQVRRGPAPYQAI